MPQPVGVTPHHQHTLRQETPRVLPARAEEPRETARRVVASAQVSLFSEL